MGRYRTQVTADFPEDAIDAVIDLYRKVFGAADPWGEGYRCFECDKIYAIGDDTVQEGVCTACSSPVQDVWPRDIVRERLFQDGMVLFAEFDITGEGADREIAALGFAASKLIMGRDFEEVYGATGLINSQPQLAEVPFVYLSDVGTDPDRRQKGLARELIAATQRVICTENPVAVFDGMRTRTDTYINEFFARGRRCIYEYPDGKTVIYAGPIASEIVEPGREVSLDITERILGHDNTPPPHIGMKMR